MALTLAGRGALKVASPGYGADVTTTTTGTATAPQRAEPEGELHRAISGRMLLFFIIGDVLGAGIYALVGEVGGRIGGAIWVAFAVALLLAIFTAFAYAELVDRLLHRRLGLVALRDVGLDRHRAVAQLGHERVDAVLAPCDERHLRALRGQRAGRRLADAAARSRDQGHRSVQPSVRHGAHPCRSTPRGADH